MIQPKLGVCAAAVVVFLLCSLTQTKSEIYYITTNSTDPLCPGLVPCLTLSQYAANLSHYLHPNTTLIFLPGTHYLTFNLAVSNQENFTMNTGSENTTAQIVCTDHLHNFHFSQLQYIHIVNLEFIGCRGNRVQNVEEFVVYNVLFRGLGISERSLQRRLIANSALVLFETRAQVINSTFVSNKGGSVRANTA